jgi:hypothetical protein
MRKLKIIVLSVTISLLGFMAFCLVGQQRLMDRTTKEFYLQRIAEWFKEMQDVFIGKWFISEIDEEQLRKIHELNKKLLTPLGPQVLPYLIIVAQVNHIIGSPIHSITKFLPHNIVLSRKPRNLLSTTEEFPEVVEKNVSYDARKVWLLWWVEGERRTLQWFTDRYGKWLVARKQGDAQKTKAMYQKLLDIGIAAIPLWLEKLQSEQDKSIRQEIIKALSYLTDGEVNLNMSPQECLNWWEANRERWTIPFPKSKKEFLEWLEKEGWEEQMLSIPSVITISRLEDEEAIDVLIRFLRHPNPLVRGTSLGRIMILFGEQLPKEYALGVGTDDWETVGDLIEMGKYDWIRKKVMKLMKWMEDDKIANKIAKELLDWWQENKGKIKIYWQRAWNVNYELP